MQVSIAPNPVTFNVLNGNATRMQSGTVTMTNNSALLSGVFFQPAWVGVGGMSINIGGVDYQILIITSSNTTYLTSPWTGATGAHPYTLYSFIYLQLYALQTFTASSDHQIIQVGSPGSSAWNRRIGCTVQMGNQIQIPQINLESTTDAVNPSEQNARWNAGFYSQYGMWISNYEPFSEFMLTPTPNPTDWAKISAYNATGIAPPPDRDVYTKTQINELFLNGDTGGPGAGVSSFNTRTGDITLTDTDVVTALTYTPVNLAGDTMTGPLVLSADPLTPMEATTRQYVDTRLSQAGSIGEYRINTGSTSPVDPGNGKVGFNNSSQKNATEIYVDNLTQNGFDASSIWANVKPGRRIAIQKMNTASIVARYTVVLVTPVMQFLRVDVTPLDASGGWPLGNNTDIAIGIEPISDEFVPIYGGTMTGPLTLSADPTLPLHAATKEYVDLFGGTGPASLVLTLEQFGGGPGGVDNLPAFEALKTYLDANSKQGATIQCGVGVYTFSGPIDHNMQLYFLGAGPTTGAAVTQFYFSNGTVGVINRRVGEGADYVHVGGDGAIYEKICFSGAPGGTDGTCNTSGDTITRLTGPGFTTLPSLAGCTVTVAGYDYTIQSVPDDDHMTVAPSFMFVSVGTGFLGPKSVGRQTSYAFAPSIVGGQFVQYGGPAANITYWNDIGNIDTDHTWVATGMCWGTVLYPGDDPNGPAPRGWIGTNTATTYNVNYRHGFELHSRVTIRDCTIINFPGNGVNAYSQRPIVGAGCNINRMAMYDTRCAGNHGHGLFLYGNDTNACNIVGCDFSDNIMGFGVLDYSFLGNSYMSCHTIGNYLGCYRAGPTGLSHTTFLECYSEDDQVGLWGNSSVWVINGTHTRFDPRFNGNSLGAEGGGNSIAGSFSIPWTTAYSSHQATGINVIQMLKYTGTYIQLGYGAYVLISGPGQWNGNLLVSGEIDPAGHVVIKTKAGAPIAADITVGHWNVYKDTTSGALKLWANDGGVMKSVTLT